MPTAEEFDEFYVDTRRRLVLQTFALTGDLGAARIAVRDAYVAARHHWAKVGRLADPEAWIRPRAWSTAQRRHTVRPWHRERNISAEQAAVIEALQNLPDAQRRVLILDHLAQVSHDEIGREIGLTLENTAGALENAVAAMGEQLGCTPGELQQRLLVLDDAAGGVKLPRAPIVRRSGIRRRRTHALVGSLVAVGLTFGAGAFVAVGAPPGEPPPKARTLVGQRMLLSPAQLAPLAAKQTWSMTETSDNTNGTGINSDCQATRFADDSGLGTWVRKFVATGSPQRALVQTVEISNSPGGAKAAYDTTLGWYAGCKAARLQLLDAYSVGGVGEQAQILRLRIPEAQDRAFVVGLARTGALTTSTVLETRGSTPAAAALVARVLADSVRNLCDSPVAGTCVTAVATNSTLPPPSGEAAGMLAIADLPPIANVTDPWAGTRADPATVNPAATTCDNTSFIKSNARKPLTRTFLIPQAKLPKRFGLSETIGGFGTAKGAARFAARVATQMKACPDKELASAVTQSIVETKGFRGSTYALWRLTNRVNQNKDEVAYWTAIIRVGRYVAQVTLTPVDRYDVRRAAFKALVTRARDRLFELSP